MTCVFFKMTLGEGAPQNDPRRGRSEMSVARLALPIGAVAGRMVLFMPTRPAKNRPR
jgi:hypothetical protein